ncbi:MAG TPA: M61 family peptidase, partial [Candidatus Thermoplasmatota archaeon]|nr:M61 family peptidase [Candidatus Thermoplasmatota archaeon]
MTVRYALAMPEPETHLFHVEMAFEPREGRPRIAMPAWAPGSYLVRDFARHVQDVEASDGRGRALAVARIDKQTWEVDARGARRVVVRYRVYANELSVQTAHLDATHGFANGPAVFAYVVGRKEEACELVVRPFPGWRVDVALRETGRGRFAAPDYDALADAPLEIGTHRRLAFRAAGVRHRIALYGRGNEDERRVVEDLRRIVEEEAALWGGLPYDDYLFIIHLTDRGSGGLEHRGSNVSLVDRFTFQPGKKYEDFLSLEAHEFFHTWNVKRLRPAALGPFDYAKESHTTLLWAMEGVTSYYDHLVLARAGLLTEARYREFLGETITKLLQQPGRLKLSLAESSFLAWIKLYKQDANWVNTGVSYYLKGELVAMVLDLEIRRRTRGRRSLDDVLRALYEEYPFDGPGIPEARLGGRDGWRETLERVTGVSWRAFWRRHIEGTDEVDFDRALRVVGWRVRPVRRDDDAEKKREKGDYAAAGAWLGVETKEVERRLRAAQVLVGSPALAAGVSPDDELVALDG